MELSVGSVFVARKAASRPAISITLLLLGATHVRVVLVQLFAIVSSRAVVMRLHFFVRLPPIVVVVKAVCAAVIVRAVVRPGRNKVGGERVVVVRAGRCSQPVGVDEQEVTGGALVGEEHGSVYRGPADVDVVAVALVPVTTFDVDRVAWLLLLMCA